MCGIVGLLNTGGARVPPEEVLRRMIALLRHRGPDECGALFSPPVALGHSRLSIIGLGNGTQPIGNEDGSLWIVYNGEVFNYLELREQLIRSGHRFVTDTDTEVLLHLYEESGPRCLEKINGQFAFAIWDARRRELFLARDRMGIRPLFFTQADDYFAFASEVKALFTIPGVQREIDPEALYQVFTFWATLAPKTIFKGVQQLQPGHYLKVKDGMIQQYRYWSTPHWEPEKSWGGSFEEAQEELAALLKDAVRLRLRADVPVGAYLSGGLDSSITTALVTRYFDNRLKTFSMSFEESAFDETPFQKELVTFFGTDHHQAGIANREIRDHLPDVLWHCETPLLRTAPVPLLMLSRLVREHNFKVVLTGEGADEVFGGYNLFKEAKVRAFWGRHPQSRLRPLLLEKLYPYVFDNPSRGRAFLQKFYAVRPGEMDDPLFSHRIRWENGQRNMIFFSEELRSAMGDFNPLKEAVLQLPPGFGRWDLFSRAQALEMDTFLCNYLLSSQGDRMAMANSLEIRLPFLDYRLVEFASSLPARWKIQGLDEKHILKRTFRKLLPENIYRRPKQPYRAPVREVFFGPVEETYVEDLLSETALKRSGYFHPSRVAHLVAKFRGENSSVSSETQNMALVGILSTQLLHRLFVEDFSGLQRAPCRLDKVIGRWGSGM
jgi:asparagine synthase (glutamine-hydrolysing)